MNTVCLTEKFRANVPAQTTSQTTSAYSKHCKHCQCIVFVFSLSVSAAAAAVAAVVRPLAVAEARLPEAAAVRHRAPEDRQVDEAERSENLREGLLEECSAEGHRVRSAGAAVAHLRGRPAQPLAAVEVDPAEGGR